MLISRLEVQQERPLGVIGAIVNDVLGSLSCEFAAPYWHTGRPSIPPERLLRALLLQAFHSVRSERRLMEQLEFNRLFRWFVGLGMDDPVWDASTFCHNRDRLMEVDVSAQLLRGVVEHRKVRWLLSRESLSPQAQRAFAARFANPTAGFVEHAIKFKTKARARKQAHDLAGTVDLQLNAIRSDPGQFVSALAEATGAIAASELPAEFKRDQWRELQDRATRMADFAHWMTAAESALGGRAGDFMEAYEHARQGAVDSAIEQDPIGEAARALAEEADWQGTATELLVELEKRVTEAVRKSQMWPGANKLCGRLRRIQAPLRTFGIVLDLDQRASGKDRARLIRIRKPERATN